MNGWVRTSVEGPAELLPVAEVVGSPVGRADAIRVSERWSVTMDSGSWASWPTRLLCGGCVVLLHLLLAWGLWQPTPAPLQRPQPEVVSVRWLEEPPAQTPEATPVPPAAVRQPPPPPVVEPPVVQQAAKPRPVAAKPKVKAHPHPKPVSRPRPVPVEPPQTASLMPTAAPASAQPVPTPAVPPLREPQYQSASLRNPAPSYPPLSRRFGEQGEVMLRVLVSPAGEALQVELLASSGHRRLDEAARKMVAKWRFIPAQRGQEKVQAWVRVPVLFQLRRKS